MQTCSRWVLYVWLWLVGLSALSPLASASAVQWERVCSASGAPQWIASPGSQEPVPAGIHGLDCALCLPAMAPGPHAMAHVVVSLEPGAWQAVRYAQPDSGASLALPPVRAPPQ